MERTIFCSLEKCIFFANNNTNKREKNHRKLKTQTKKYKMNQNMKEMNLTNEKNWLAWKNVKTFLALFFFKLIQTKKYYQLNIINVLSLLFKFHSFIVLLINFLFCFYLFYYYSFFFSFPFFLFLFINFPFLIHTYNEKK